MAIQYFIDKLRNKYWIKGSTWEFDWYLHIFFLEVMNFSVYPMEINYEEAILGDNYLDQRNWDASLKKFSRFLDDPKRVDKLLQDQSDILNAAEELLQAFKNEKPFDAGMYEKVQKNLSLLMASVSVVLDNLISTKIKEIARLESIPEEIISGYIVDQTSHTKLNESNNVLLGIYKSHSKDIDGTEFDFAKIVDTNLKDVLNKHANMYGWLNTGEQGSSVWTPQDFLTQLKPLLTINKKQISSDKVLQLKTISGKSIITKIIQISSNDNLAADIQVELDFLFQKLLEKTLGKSYRSEVTDNLTFSELMQVCSDPALVDQYKDRVHKWRVAWPENGKVSVHYFDSEEEFKEVWNLVADPVTSSAIRGMVACRGVAEGIVRIVETQTDIAAFQEGEIMVAEKTQPKYVMAMTKAAAIVTDFGGITSHAAIIAREFEIPCIVGTGSATKVLKNGQRVRVDADSGKVIVL